MQRNSNWPPPAYTPSPATPVRNPRPLIAVLAVALGVAVGIILVLALSGHRARSAPGTSLAVTRACDDIRSFETGNSPVTFAASPQSQQAETDSAGTPFNLDLTNWIDDIENGATVTQTRARAAAVSADCTAAGVNVFGGN